MALPAIAGYAAAAVAVFVTTLLSGSIHFAPGACDRLEPCITSTIVGQDLAVKQFSDAVCDHLANKEPLKPLVISVHGPVGVGKSLLHLLAARTLYAARPHPDMRCPGADCPGYKVLYGMDYTAEDRAAQHAALRSSLFDHVSSAPESLIVIEEYDKLDCQMRGFFRHLLEHGRVGNVSIAKSIVILESNTGYMTLHSMLSKAGSREAISPEHAQRELKDLVFSRWQGQGCEDRADTLKTVGIIDFFLPFFPLEKQHIAQLFEARIAEKAKEVDARKLGPLLHNPSVVDFLAARVDFDGSYPIEGAKEVNTLVTRYISRPVREWIVSREEEVRLAAKSGKGAKSKERKGGVDVCGGRLKVTANGKALEIEAIKAPPNRNCTTLYS